MYILEFKAIDHLEWVQEYSENTNTMVFTLDMNSAARFSGFELASILHRYDNFGDGQWAIKQELCLLDAE